MSEHRADHGHQHPHHHHHDHHQAPGGHDWSAVADQIELDGEIMAAITAEAIAATRAAVTDPVRTVVDAGAGPGVGTAALAAAFPDATVVAVDATEALLERASHRAHRLGVGDRVATRTGDLEHGLPVDGPVDVVWSSMVLHHVDGPARVLADAHAALRPGGVLTLVEFGPRSPTLPDELGVGRPGFAARHAEAMAGALVDHLPPGALDLDWPSLLGAAGFELVEHRLLRLDRPAPLDDDARRWVVHGLHRSAPMVAERLDEDDRATLEALLDRDGPHDVARRDDLELHQCRTLLVARRG